MAGAVYLNRDVTGLVYRARMAAGLSQAQLSDRLGLSKRTMGRVERGESSLRVPEVITLARLAHPRDPDLARELAAAASETLESLGLTAPKVTYAPPTKLLVEAVVCAAVEALAMAPGPVRLGLHAAFKRTREMGLTLEDVESALAPASGPPEKA
jgi:transcriptional regulator with XRE-family HTH domain